MPPADCSLQGAAGRKNHLLVVRDLELMDAGSVTASNSWWKMFEGADGLEKRLSSNADATSPRQKCLSRFPALQAAGSRQLQQVTDRRPQVAYS